MKTVKFWQTSKLIRIKTYLLVTILKVKTIPTSEELQPLTIYFEIFFYLLV